MPDETTISSFQNYSHEGSGDGEESICWNKMLPINEITNSIFFYQVIGFKEKIQLDQFIDENIPPEDIKNITRSDPLNNIVQPTLALSIGLINPEYSMPTNIRQIDVQPGKPMLVGMDRTLFPGKRVKPYSGGKKDPIVVDDPSKLDIGVNSYNKQEFIVTQKTKEILMEYGEAYAKDPDSGNKVLIKLDSKKVHVDSFGQITQKNTLLVGEQELDLKISQNNLPESVAHILI